MSAKAALMVFPCFADDEVTTSVDNSADNNGGGPVVSRCRCLPSVGVCGPVSHHATSHVWTLSGGHRGLHPDPRQSPGGT